MQVIICIKKMLFNSFEFLLFYPIVTLIYFLLSQRFRWLWLLAASCYFYMFFKPVYILILAGTIIIDYLAGLQIARLKGYKKKWMLIVSIVANVGVLAVFKYYNFFSANVNHLLHVGGYNFRIRYLDMLLPIGLSFHTFQAMSYTIEVYRGNQKPEKHFGLYALYVMFYPQLVAGPIERPQNILHQLHTKQPFNKDGFAYGLKLILWGLFKKVFVADRLSTYVLAAFENYKNQTGSTLIVATLFFTMQIYCDFSGYSDIARGAAKTMGYDLMINFRRPYLAENITDFWRRWHISLSSWFKDYVYFPLGGNKVYLLKWCRNIMIVFLLSGLWHGANWTFIVWGLLHAVFTIVHKLIAKPGGFIVKLFSSTAGKVAAIILNLCVVSFAWIFFRALNLNDAVGIIHKIITGWHDKVFVKTFAWTALTLVGIFIVFAADVVEEYNLKFRLLGNPNIFVRLTTVCAIIMAILCFGVFQNISFIYFQF